MRVPGAFPVLLVAAAALQAPAVPITYAFEGTVTYSNTGDFAVGDPVSYLFLADRDVYGWVEWNGLVEWPADWATPDSYVDFFYSEYLGGSAFAADLPYDSYGTHHLGRTEIYSGIHVSLLLGNNRDPGGSDLVSVFNPTATIEEWTVGMGGFQGYNSVWGNTTGQIVESDLTLASIRVGEPVAAVPEPGTTALCFMGLAGLAFAESRRSRRERMRVQAG
jgi:hypothetical protein